MIGKKSISFLLVLSVMAAVMSVSADLSKYQNYDIEKVVKEIDELYRSEASYSELEMEIVTPHWQRTLSMNCWTEGMDKTFIRITSPPKEEGVGTLRIENEMWNYLPKTNKVIKIPPSMMMSSWMGSDFTNDDLVKESSMIEDYGYEFIAPEDDENDYLYIRFIPREGKPIVWGKIVIAVRAEDYLPVWEKYYDEKDNLMRVMNFKDIKIFDGRKIPAVMEMISQNKEGNKTIIRYNKAEFNRKIDADVFSLRNLRSP
ncbi:MAG: outer membrane lipoprotein-sorting protein [Candidatus Zixiibacteriota bacterium]|nr:MAG: outer membrane lipoprotein-sorting protein [candidate division Zixibacteria bacterium]